MYVSINLYGLRTPVEVYWYLQVPIEVGQDYPHMYMEGFRITFTYRGLPSTVNVVEDCPRL
jgi:hypothetical protein